jgi:hypothetical protein
LRSTCAFFSLVVVIDQTRISIAAAIDSYLDLVKHHRSLRTYRTYRYTLDTLPSQLMFPKSKSNPDSESDMIVKRVAERAELNCGQCVTKHGNKCAQGPARNGM